MEFNNAELKIIQRAITMYLANNWYSQLSTKEKKTYDEVEQKLIKYFDV